MEIPNPDTPLARWRINLRECLSYTILVNCPDFMSHDVNKDWTDMQCIDVLEKLQKQYHLHEGTIPASVFAVAINHFTARALDEGLKASRSAEEGGQPLPLNQDYENVESWGLRPKLLAPGIIRKRKVLVLSDSGAMIYRRPPKKGTPQKVKPNNYLNNDSCSDPWINIMANYEVGGADWRTWSNFLQQFVDSHCTVMEMCPDGTKRYPAHISVVVLHNLNGTNLGYASQEANKSEEQRVTCHASEVPERGGETGRDRNPHVAPRPVQIGDLLPDGTSKTLEHARGRERYRRAHSPAGQGLEDHDVGHDPILDVHQAIHGPGAIATR